MPLHVWLPLAHPAAPSHVSALMSGVMTKVAVYAFIRIVFDLSGPPQWWEGMIVLALGGITAVMGVLYALMEHDLKRLLAYHTIENIGIIFIGLGLALAFQANDLGPPRRSRSPPRCFMCSIIAVQESALLRRGRRLERDRDPRHGTSRRTHSSHAADRVRVPDRLRRDLGAAAVQRLRLRMDDLPGDPAQPELPQWGLKLIVPAVGALLALSAALAAACFVKAFGVSFLGRPRSAAAGQAKEVDGFSRMTMLAFAGLCLFAGILPGLFIDGLAPVVQSLLGARMPAQAAIPWLSLVPIAESRSSYNGLLVFFFIAASATIATLSIHLLASNAVRRAPPWDCGFPDASPITQYSAGSFAQPIRRVFGTLVFAAREHVTMPPPGSMEPARIEVTLRDLVWEMFYAPIAGAVAYAAERLNALQFLTIRRYLSLVFLLLITLLLVLAIWL